MSVKNNRIAKAADVRDVDATVEETTGSNSGTE